MEFAPYFPYSNLTSQSNYINTKPRVGTKFKCIICPEAFSHISTLKHHVQHHHNNAREAFPFLCQICDQGFFTRWTLKQHSEKHSSGVECHVCAKVYTHTSSLLKHWELDHRLRKCRRCKKTFTIGFEFDTHVASCL